MATSEYKLTRDFSLILILVSILSGCTNEPEVDYDYIKSRFSEFSEKIQRVQYNAQTIDTFARGGTVWNHEGAALIERDNTDELLGVSFYGKRADLPDEFLYDKGNGFVISKEVKRYRIERQSLGFLGSPGGQMISRDMFFLDTAYQTAKVLEAPDRYIVTYAFADDTTYNVTNNVKIVEFDKANFFPSKVTRSYEMLGKKAVHQMVLRDVKINDQVKTSIAEYKTQIADFEIIPKERREVNKILNTRLSDISLPDVLNGRNESISFGSDKITLIDFWEVWCGPCIKSFSEVERLKRTYDPKLQVIGVLTEDKESAVRLIDKKEITFVNLLADKDYLKKFSVDSYPRYFLVDADGTVRKEYFGFSADIGADIKRMLLE